MRNYLLYESEHYLFHYLPQSIAEKDIVEIACEQEKSFEEIVDVLMVIPPFKINYYLLNSAQEVGEEYGDNEPCNGFAREPHDIYAVYNEKVKCIGPHEDAHIISYLISIPESVFIREGLAMYFDKTWWNKPNEFWVKEMIENHNYLLVKDLLKDDYFDKIDCSLSYPIAGAFTNFLIIKLGQKKYLELYRLKDFSANSLNNALNCKDFEQLFIEWIETL